MKKITLDLTEIDGNAFALMGAFQQRARKEGWLGGEIAAVLDQCKTGDYDHLVAALAERCCSEDDRYLKKSVALSKILDFFDAYMSEGYNEEQTDPLSEARDICGEILSDLEEAEAEEEEIPEAIFSPHRHTLEDVEAAVNVLPPEEKARIIEQLEALKKSQASRS